MFLEKQGFSFLFVFLFLLSGCGIPRAQTGSSLGRDAIINDANNALTRGDCATALANMVPLYNSASSDNYIRLITASAYGCGAGIDFLDLAQEMMNNSASLAGTGFWRFIAEYFPSTVADTRAESALLGFDALHAMLRPGVIVPAAFQVNASTYNVGSTRYTERDGDANGYLPFLAVAALGALGNRYGAPDATFVKTVDLPWTSAAAVDSDGCAYASAVVNMLDGLTASVPLVSGPMAGTFNTILTTFDTVVNAACDIGCQNLAVPGWTQSGCTVTTACASCPTALRDRSACQGVVADQVSCAASGIINFINEDLVAGWN